MPSQYLGYSLPNAVVLASAPHPRGVSALNLQDVCWVEKLHRITVDQVDGGLPQSRMNHSATVYVDIYLRDVASPAQWVAKGFCRALHAKLRPSPRTHRGVCGVSFCFNKHWLLGSSTFCCFRHAVLCGDNVGRNSEVARYTAGGGGQCVQKHHIKSR